MNGIPLIFNERQIQSTKLGGRVAIIPTRNEIPCTLLLLNRGTNHYRQRNIDSLLKIGFKEIISVENSASSYQLEDFSQRYPQITFVIPQEKITVGDMINIGINESSCESVLVIWNDLNISQTLVTEKIITKLMQKELFCVAPHLSTPKLTVFPIKMTPTIANASFGVLPTTVEKESEKTVYPFDFMGLYNKKKFMQLGGFDYSITTPYWQNIDLSLRAWLWGEEISISKLFTMQYDDESPLEDISPDGTQLRFFLKNCAPKFSQDYAYIPKMKYFAFQSRFPGTPFEALTEFRKARRWVAINKYRFKTDIVSLIKNWDNPVTESEQ